ncbi:MULTISPECIES: IclR family transcriptional regulator [unclassified Haladaptatus]|uniref:IclR family transcriptional regulator n=1 Tax=unclassified Haladaptatus TaxID=2622732 RepID=UPI00209BE647|nr:MULTISPECIES: IclR family transcriptional regulator [unclassified Haladaptatus]MCO8243646.1 IclR family transcriptional regulator [Haladaptatus sp. AB643]MCO8255055.1 IclR family transcriptional regulator [Haladaptatus sp. AB618]
MEKQANHPVRTTEKTLGLVDHLDAVDQASLGELEAEVDMSKSGIHNHLSTLREHGYVEKVGEEYRLTLKFLSIGGHRRNQFPLYQLGRSKVNQLAADTGMLANLMTEEGGRGVYLFQSRGDYAVNLDTYVGYRIRLHNIGIGKAILAYLPRERVEEILDKWGLPKATDHTITDREALFEELEVIRERGYATDHEERTEGLTCIGAPVRLDGDVLGAVSISAPTKRLGNTGFDNEIIAQVESTANQLALDIKYS